MKSAKITRDSLKQNRFRKDLGEESRIIYGLTTREGSLTNNFLKKDEELGIRAEAVFRRQKLLKERQIITTLTNTRF